MVQIDGLETVMQQLWKLAETKAQSKRDDNVKRLNLPPREPNQSEIFYEYQIVVNEYLINPHESKQQHYFLHDTAHEAIMEVRLLEERKKSTR